MTAMSQIVVTPQPVPLGKSGISVAPIAWGMWRFAGATLRHAQALVETALAAGITLFDTADIYGFDGAGGFGAAEALLGRVFAASPALRDRMVLATKGGITPPVPYDSSARHLADALDRSLARLGVDQVDLYQIHRPDLLTHPQEVARTLEDAVRAGKVRAIGVSNHGVAQIQALQAFLGLPLASSQPQFSPLHLDPLTDGQFDHAMAGGMAILAWSPLGGGRLGDPQDDRARRVAAVLDRKAAEHDVDRAAVACSWVMAHPVRPIPIVGTQNIERLAASGAAYRVRWTRAEWYDILVAARGEPLP